MTFAFSGYMAGTYLPEGGPLQAVLDKYDLDQPVAGTGRRVHGQGRLRQERQRRLGQGRQAGHASTSAPRPSSSRSLAPLTQQLKNAGFDAVQAPVDDTWLPDITNGNFDTMIFVHCGSLSEPLETLQHYHSKFSRPLGETGAEPGRRHRAT